MNFTKENLLPKHIWKPNITIERLTGAGSSRAYKCQRHLDNYETFSGRWSLSATQMPKAFGGQRAL